MKKSIINLALKTAREKLHLHPQLEYFPHYTFIIQKNRVVDWATNLSDNPPIHYGYQHRILDPFYKPKLHSEIAAFKKAKGILIKNEPFEIVNIRLNKNKELRLSKPCICCFRIMQELGCSKFYYSCNFGFLKLIV